MASRNYEKEFDSIKKEIAGLTNRLQELGSDGIEDAKEVAGEYYDQAKDVAGQAWDKTKVAGTKSKEYVEEHPWQSLAAGAVLGLAVGMLLGRSQNK